MKLTTLFIALIWTISSEGQSMAEIEKLLSEKKFIPFKSYIDTATDNFQKTNYGTKAMWKQLRDIAPGYQEGMIDIEEHFKDPTKPANVGSAYLYRLNLIATQDSIIYYEWRGRGMNDNDVTEITGKSVDEKRFSNLTATFRRVFGVELNTNELFKIHVYGKVCDMDAEPPQMREKLNQLLRTRDVKTLNIWLTSPNSEKQVYAIEGFSKLQRKGYKLTPRQVSIIRYIKGKKGTIATCVGCFHQTVPIEFAWLAF